MLLQIKLHKWAAAVSVADLIRCHIRCVLLTINAQLIIVNKVIRFQTLSVW